MAENKEPSQRQLRGGQEIKRILAAFIQKGEIRNLEELTPSLRLQRLRCLRI